MNEPDGSTISSYDADTTDLILAEAADVLRAAGFASAHMVIIGGLVPTLLIPAPENDAPAHIGTADIDICLTLALLDGDTEQYERLEAVLRRMGYEPGESSFRWIRSSPPRITLEFFCPSSPDRPAGTMHRPNATLTPTAKHNFGTRLSALSLDAGELLTTDTEMVTRAITLPREKGTIELQLLVAGPLAFLCAKADALAQRDKPKDAYDIVWFVESWPGGPAAAAADFSRRDAYSREVRQDLNRLSMLFSDIGSVGARSYALFTGEGGDTGAGPLLSQRRAVGAVAEFLSALPPLKEPNQ